MASGGWNKSLVDSFFKKARQQDNKLAEICQILSTSSGQGITSLASYCDDTSGEIVAISLIDTVGNVTWRSPDGTLLAGQPVGSSLCNSSAIVGVDNRHVEVLDTGNITLTGISNYSYSVISGSATVTINGVTISGIPTGFDARQGEATPNHLLHNVTIVGDSMGTRVIIYYEL